MRVLLINLPHPERVQRRFRCSYQAPRFLFPPLELLSVGGALREREIGPVRLIDAIASDWNIEKTISEVRQWKPNVIITMPGFDILEEDLNALKFIRGAAPDASVILFGYIVSQFPKEIMELLGMGTCTCYVSPSHVSPSHDAVVIGEPEIAIANHLQGMGTRNSTGKAEYMSPYQLQSPPFENLDDLASPDYSLISLDRYSDFLFEKPFAALQTSRGCPFKCTYCVRPYGRRVAYHSPERVIEDVKRLVRSHGVRGLRFEDDTFPLQADRAIAIARGIAPLGIRWSCLSRPDTVDETIAAEFAKSGCRRFYLGIESASDRLLERLGRGHTAHEGLKAARIIKKAGMEVAGFFLTGIPGETEEDLLAAVDLARRAELDYVGVSTLIPYPGTALFDSGEVEVSFNLLPFYSHFADYQIRRRGRAWEKLFYRRYYYHPGYIFRRLPIIMRHPAQAFRAAAVLTRHLIESRGEGKHGDLI